MVEHSAVNRDVVGSSPTWGAKPSVYSGGFLYVNIDLGIVTKLTTLNAVKLHPYIPRFSGWEFTGAGAPVHLFGCRR